MAKKRNILVADGGSGKVDWLFWSEPNTPPVRYQTGGLNPLVLTSSEMAVEMRSALQLTDVHHIYFYGASCSTPERNAVVEKAFQQVFPGVPVTVNHDLTAAGRALWQRETGVAAILGTGSNCGFYNGEHITRQMNSLGYIIGDEGSGADIAKHLLRGYFYGAFSSALTKKLSKKIPDNVIDLIYNAKKPNHELASLTQIAGAFIHEPEIQEVVKDSLNKFVHLHLKPLAGTEKKVGFVGSVAHYFHSLLKEELHNAGFARVKILRRPVDELLKYHIENE